MEKQNKSKSSLVSVSDIEKARSIALECIDALRLFGVNLTLFWLADKETLSSSLEQKGREHLVRLAKDFRLLAETRDYRAISTIERARAECNAFLADRPETTYLQAVTTATCRFIVYITEAPEKPVWAEGFWDDTEYEYPEDSNADQSQVSWSFIKYVSSYSKGTDPLYSVDILDKGIREEAALTISYLDARAPIKTTGTREEKTEKPAPSKKAATLAGLYKQRARLFYEERCAKHKKPEIYDLFCTMLKKEIPKPHEVGTNIPKYTQWENWINKP